MRPYVLAAALALPASFCAATARGDGPATLPGTKPLTLQGDLAAQLVEGVDRFLLKKTEESVAGRAAFWKRDVSSPEAYGTCIGNVIEESPLNPSTPYAASKAAADMLLSVYHKQYGLLY